MCVCVCVCVCVPHAWKHTNRLRTWRQSEDLHSGPRINNFVMAFLHANEQLRKVSRESSLWLQKFPKVSKNRLAPPNFNYLRMRMTLWFLAQMIVCSWWRICVSEIYLWRKNGFCFCFYLPPVKRHSYDVCWFKLPYPQNLWMPLGSWSSWGAIRKSKSGVTWLRYVRRGVSEISVINIRFCTEDQMTL